MHEFIQIQKKKTIEQLNLMKNINTYHDQKEFDGLDFDKSD